jgi:16S rRNA (guanine966-N2)-methyltransferase
MRIIGGSVGGRRLKAPRGAATRPTADRVREAIFNMLVARGPVPERVLDVYAGTGALGLEALSRGAREAVFVEQHAPTCALIRDNARDLGLDGAARVVCARTLDFLKRERGLFGWIFLDPPYDSGELDEAIALAAPLVDEPGALIAEHDWHEAPREPVAGSDEPMPELSLCHRRRYGQTAVSLYIREAPIR